MEQMTLCYEEKCMPAERSASAGQCAEILEALRRGESMTALDALRRFGCLRLAARIFDLRAAGHDIEQVMVTKDRKTFAVYALKAAA